VKYKRVQCGGCATRTGDTRNTYKILVRKLLGKCQLGKWIRRWEDNTKKRLREVEWKVIEAGSELVWTLVLILVFRFFNQSVGLICLKYYFCKLSY
jgi:hypothetical protein